MSPADEAMLDNPAYASLCGAHARFAQTPPHASDPSPRLD
jgi:hypothetical protein